MVGLHRPYSAKRLLFFIHKTRITVSRAQTTAVIDFWSPRLAENWSARLREITYITIQRIANKSPFFLYKWFTVALLNKYAVAMVDFVLDDLGGPA